MQHIMIKIALVLACILCTSAILSTFAVEDEFAEFDDFASTESESNENEAKILKDQPHESSQSKISPNVAPEGDTRERVEIVSDKGPGTVDAATKDEATKTQGKKPDLKLVEVLAPRAYNWESYYIEIAFILGGFMYFINFFAGSTANNTLAHHWYESTRDLLKQQFSLVGGAPQLNEGGQKRDEDSDSSTTAKKQRGLIKVTESLYTIWNSGRIGIDGLLIEINLLKRQDLFSIGLNLLKPTKDTIVLRFLLNQEGYDNFVFCLAHKALAPKLARDMVDISTFCPKRKPISQYGIDVERLFVMTELSDVVSFILDQQTVDFIKTYQQSINYIHITDQYSTCRSEEVISAQKLVNSKRMATFSFTLTRDGTECNEYIKFSLSLLDKLRRFRLARDSKQKSEKNRQKINDIIQKNAFTQRQEAAQAKKEELRRLEKERIYNEDDPEKQRRWEKKEAKRELKKSKTRVKQLKVKSM